MQVTYKKRDGSMNKQINTYNKLIAGDFSSVVYYKVEKNDSRVKDICNYLDSQDVKYVTKEINSPKYGKGLEIKLR